jgi:hypothetical protein
MTVFLRKKKKSSEYFLMDMDNKEDLYVTDTETNDSGEFTFHQLESSDNSIEDGYIIKLSKSGYYLPRKIIIKVIKGIENQLEYMVDLTKFVELKGRITINGEPATDGELILNSQLLNNSEEKILINTFLDKNGNYSFQGILPGSYSISILCFDSYELILKKTKFIEIEEEKLKVLDMHFEVDK